MRDHRERDLRTEECREYATWIILDYAFASVVSLDCNNSNGLWMYCVLCVDFGHELCVIILMDFGCITLYVWTLDMSYVLNGVFVIVLWSYIYVMHYKLSIYT